VAPRRVQGAGKSHVGTCGSPILEWDGNATEIMSRTTDESAGQALREQIAECGRCLLSEITAYRGSTTAYALEDRQGRERDQWLA